MIIQVAELAAIREKHKDKKIVYCTGGFDLTHAGHIIFFEDCKKLGDILVVAVARDISLKKRKGDSRPILNQHIRLKTVDSLKPVDYAFISSEQSVSDLLATIRMGFEQLRPDIYAINEEAFDIPARKALAERYNVKMVILPRWFPPEFEGVSTSIIIEKIRSL
ncbi:MAG TPA: adenylyltransferase/cytidyltransferase family protein [Candidatus Nanoarchaeia archaeon]|nr:adenylyltransferase/cytidyltransferase family protein [Candidatus Nanoarchaeia archaeon]